MQGWPLGRVTTSMSFQPTPGANRGEPKQPFRRTSIRVEVERGKFLALQ